MSESSEHEIKQYLTFVLGNELYGFNVLKIREVLELPRITKMPKTPEYMAGVINLRGKVVPVVDLRLKFENKNIQNTVDTSIIIVEVNYSGEMIQVGALVDSVKAVIKLDDNQLEAPPKIGMNINADLISALGKYEDHFIIIFNIDKIFSEEELAFSVNDPEKNPLLEKIAG